MVFSSGPRVEDTVERELKFGETEWVARPWLLLPCVSAWACGSLSFLPFSLLFPIPMGFESRLNTQWPSETSFQISVLSSVKAVTYTHFWELFCIWEEVPLKLENVCVIETETN